MAAADGGWATQLKAMGEAPGQQRCMEKLSPAGGRVCVTGASGFIALHLVKQLLEGGYAVVGTVRCLRNDAKLLPLRELQKKHGEDKLRIMGGVDCTKPDTFSAAVEGCVGVFHTASPLSFNSTDPLKDLVAPAIQGTLGCLEACQKAGSVKRIVITSSSSAITDPGKLPWDYTYSSKDWSTVSWPDASGVLPEPAGAHGYRYSKIAAEKAAWDFAAQEGVTFDVACINPTLVCGHNYNVPASLEDLNTSSLMVLRILTGETAPREHSMGWVDVGDAAKAHILAYEHPEAGGRRFLCSADETPTWTELALWLKELFPNQPVITEPPEGGVGVRMSFDTSGIKGFSGFQFKSLRSSLKEQCESLIAQGWASSEASVPS
mmetsp:Transcript_92054/g.213952  ORF Transcript_92054/g.213952 Transcript_92054/m.213952 type:complete len:377 (-) Transcript_92054:51-1181(-)